MIGPASLLLELALPLFTTVMFLAIAVQAVRQRSWGGAAMTLLILAFAGIVDARFYFQLQSRRFLTALSPAEVADVQVGRKRLARPDQVAAVVESLNRIEWFSANHGGWGESEWLVLRLKAGGRRLFRVARYGRAEGAILEFGRPAGRAGGFHDGYAFCPGLPAVLEKLGAPLPAAPPPARAAAR